MAKKDFPKNLFINTKEYPFQSFDSPDELIAHTEEFADDSKPHTQIIGVYKLVKVCKLTLTPPQPAGYTLTTIGEERKVENK